MKIKNRFAFLFLCLFAATAFSADAQNLTVRDIMREPSIAGQRAESERLAPDGSKVIFLWNQEAREPKDLYVVSTNGGEPRKILSPRDLPLAAPQPTTENKLNYGLIVKDDFARARENQIGNLDWSPDSRKILFAQNGDLFTLNLEDAAARPKRLTKTQTAEFAARWLTNEKILFSQNGNFFVIDTREVSLNQISKEANPQAFVSVQNATPTKNGALVAYVVSDASKQKALFVPNYLDEFVQAPTTRRGFTEQKIFVARADESLANSVEVKLPKAEGASYIRSLDWAADNQSLIVDRVDKDTKRRQLFYVYKAGGKDQQTVLITEETDEKWIAPLSGIVEPNPKDAGEIIYGSERDGFNHLYLARVRLMDASKEVRNSVDLKMAKDAVEWQLTKGKFQVEWAKWSANGDEIVFSSTQKNTAGREFYTLERQKTSDFKLTQIPSLDDGMKISPQLSESGDKEILLYEGSRWNAPTELFAARVCPRCAGLNYPVQITKTTPESFKQIKWNAPQFVDIPSRDGKVIKSKIYTPENFDKSKKYPMVVFVHGAGYLQNTINGWNNYYREFMFNEILTGKGYVVLDIDYRGSAGYGRAWRTDVYDFLGGSDYEDHLDAIDYAVKNYAVNPQKVGVYGGSYGGFMAEMMAFRTDKIACAAALRPVADWKNYFYSSPVYTAERLGFPDKNPEGYKRSSPISYADKLNKPLLILHGLVDDNVPAQDSMQLIEKLIRLEKTEYFQTMFFPSESHGFARPTSWADEYERILSFFEKNLK